MRHLKPWLFLIVLFSIVLYLGTNFFNLSQYVQQVRLTKLMTYITIVILIVPSTIVFQTVVNSRYLTPSILGIDAVYVFLQSLYYFFGIQLVGTYQLNSVLGFVIQISVMIGLFWFSTKFIGMNWYSTLKESIWLMVGLVIGTILRSLSTFFQVLMDPNEYSKLQSQLFPSFQGLSTSLLLIAMIVAVSGLFYFYQKRYVLDVYHLGKEMAMTLGVDIQKETPKFLLLVILMIATATAVVGPLTFLGFMIANITYYVTPKHQHIERMIYGCLIGCLFVIGGQYIVERLVNYQYNLSMIIEGVGGILFFILLFKKEGIRLVNH